VHYNRLRHRTYTGWTDRAGDVVVAAHGPLYEARKVVAHLGYVNDHSSPSLLMRPDGRLMVFYSRHRGGQLFYRIATDPESISNWGNERVVTTNSSGGHGYTYPNPVLLRNRLFLFWRGGNWQPTYSRILRGERWSRARTLVRGAPGQRPYVKYAADGKGRVLMAFNAAHPREGNSSLYFASFSRRGSLFRASGTRIASRARLPIRPRQADSIHNQRRTGLRSWVQDIAATRSGRPVIVYAVFPSAQHHQYRYARWNGRRWIRHVIIRNSGGSISSAPFESFYAGGITLDHNHPSIVYLSRRVGNVNEVEMWRTRTGGRTWSRTRITSNSTTDNIRPISPRGLDAGESEVLWLRGRYGHYRTFSTSVLTKSPWSRPLENPVPAAATP
jgi:BNR repeat-containing family member